MRTSRHDVQVPFRQSAPSVRRHRRKYGLRSPSFRSEIDVATETIRLRGDPGKRFWKPRRDRVTSALLALLIAVLLLFFVLGRGPGTLIWLTGSRLTWLPFVGGGLHLLSG